MEYLVTVRIDPQVYKLIQKKKAERMLKNGEQITIKKFVEDAIINYK